MVTDEKLLKGKSCIPAEALSYFLKSLKLRRTFVVDIKTKLRNLVSKLHSLWFTS